MKEINVITLWDNAKEYLSDTMAQETYERWISVITPIKIENDKVYLGVSDNFFKDWLKNHYLHVIENAIIKVAKKKFKVKFIDGYKLAKEKPVKATYSSTKTTTINLEYKGYNPKYVFENFVVGDSNRLGYAFCEAVAKAPGAIYNPLFIYGNTGLGKTHIGQAIAQDMLNRKKRAKVEYLSSEEFANNFIEAIQKNTLRKFRRHYRSLDLLLIDDVQFFKGKERMQEEFFHTFNTLFNANKQIVLISDRPPHEISGLEQRLVSRFECGQIVDFAAPSYETRVAILRKKQDVGEVQLTDEILCFIADKIKSNVRRLEGALMRLTGYISVSNSKIDLQVAEELLAPLLREEKNNMLTVAEIQKEVAEFFDIRVSDLLSNKRPKNIALPRQIAMYLSRNLTEDSFPSIGERFHRNHATILHAVKSVEKRCQEDKAFLQEINNLTNKLNRP